jgi:chorismate mutase/prephenate dehydratase
MQSAKFLSEHPEWETIGMQNNAFAAQKVKNDGDRTQAAIASEKAANLYDLDILKRGINQEDNNETRFIIVTNKKMFRSDASKISICFELPHKSGTLYRILSHFIYNDLNMTKIESRPLEGRNWEYRFFVDFTGNLNDSAVKSALLGIREESGKMKILGCY